MKFYLIGILLVLISCNGQKKTVSEGSAESQLIHENDTMELLLQEGYSEFEVAETMIIKNEKGLRSFYAKINRTRKPGIPVPSVDFTKEMIVIHCNGEQSKIGIPTLIMEKETDSTLRLISKFESETKYDNVVVKTNPFCVYKIPITSKEIIIEKGVK